MDTACYRLKVFLKICFKFFKTYKPGFTPNLLTALIYDKRWKFCYIQLLHDIDVNPCIDFLQYELFLQFALKLFKDWFHLFAGWTPLGAEINQDSWSSRQQGVIIIFS